MITRVCQDARELAREFDALRGAERVTDRGLVWPFGYDQYPCLLLITFEGQKLLGLRDRDEKQQRILLDGWDAESAPPLDLPEPPAIG
jgi:hypothetical protein